MSEILPWEGDLPKRLRHFSEGEASPSPAGAMTEAADEIERLRSAIKIIVDCYDGINPAHPAEIAREALLSR